MMVVAMAGPEISSCIRRKLGRMSVPRSAAHNINTATHHTVTVLCLRPSFTVTSPSYGQSTATAGPGHCMLELCMLSLSVPTLTSPLHTYSSLATKQSYEDHLHLPLSLPMQLSPSPRLLLSWGLAPTAVPLENSQRPENSSSKISITTLNEYSTT